MVKIKIKVELTSTIKEMAGLENAIFELPAGSNLAQLLEVVEKKFGDSVTGKRPEYQWRHSTDEVMVVLNGQVVSKPDMVTTFLKEEDTVTLVPPHSGG